MSNGSETNAIVIPKDKLLNYAIILGLLAIAGFFAYRSGDTKKQFMPGGPTCECSKCECNGLRARPYFPHNGATGQTGQVGETTQK